jgi:hypothetical protein
VIYSYGTVLLDLLSGKHIPPSHVCFICFFSRRIYFWNLLAIPLHFGTMFAMMDCCVP